MAAGDNTENPPDNLATLRRKSRPKLLRSSSKSGPAQPALFSAPEPAPPKPARATPRRPVVPPAVPIQEDRRIYTVRALVGDIRHRTESAYLDIWVEGEISNCRPAASGHLYFTLKDGEAQLPVVLFRRQGQLLRFRPADGLAVLARGRVSIYESRGQLQLIAETLEPRGAGALQLAFEQLKRRLAEEGLFDAARKRPLPAFPHCIGIVTSPAGAVIQDIVTVIRRRHARLNLLVYPATMQGASCCSTVAEGIRWFNSKENAGRVDLIVVARGGGSIEDLAGFNDESLARAIAASSLPIVSAIGHETDFTIADFVADLRAPTPSAAAELITAAQHRIEDRVAALASRLARGIDYRLIHARQSYARLSADSVLARLRDRLGNRAQRLDDLAYRAEAAINRRLRSPLARLNSIQTRLQQQAPTARLVLSQRRLGRSLESLDRASIRILASRRSRAADASARLQTLSPLAVLNRGYALIYSDGGALLRSSADTAPGEQIRARLAIGTLTASVLETHPK